ncbi:Increased rDNA silencing protein [Ciborinia camelliae]|nr:Increased rDNA silencing protein [Ciborinia camelliae]
MTDENSDDNSHPVKVTPRVIGSTSGIHQSPSTSTLHSNTSPRTISHNPSTNSLRSINAGGAAQNAAIAGASLAFSNSGKSTPPVPNKNKPQLNSNLSKNGSANTYSGRDGALAAAAKVGGGGAPGGGGGRTRSPSKVSVMDERVGYGQQILGQQLLGRERTGVNETTDGGSIVGSEYQGGQRGAQKRAQQRSNGHLQPPFSSGTSTPDSGLNAKNNSVAFMAANLAAKRSRDNSPNHTGQSQGMRMGTGMGMGGWKQASPLPSRRQSYASIGNTSSTDSGERRLDVSSIPPTSSLVGMWEQTERGVKEGGGGSGAGNDILDRQDSSRRRPASSHALIAVSESAILARPISSHAPISEPTKSATKPLVLPSPSSSEVSITGQMMSTSKPPVRPRSISSHTPASEAVRPSPKSPAQKPAIHNTRPASSHSPLPNLSTKPSMQNLSPPVSAHGNPPTQPSANPSMQSVRPTSSHALELTESSPRPSVQKPSMPPPRRTSANVPAPGERSTEPPMQAPRPRSMHTPILNSTDSTDPSLKPPTQPPRRASTIKTPPKPSRPTPASLPPMSKQSYNNDYDEDDEDDASSDDSFVSASSQPKPKSPSWRAKVAQQNKRQTSSISPMDAHSLANAIVAGSLASSRASSPSGTLRPPAPPPSRRHKSISIFHSDNSRTPTPPQNIGPGNTTPMLKTTMRKPKTGKELKEEEGEGEKRRARKHLVKKHPNKHHEGDRKRWRDVITERERKRYEAVWASNRGLFPDTVSEEGERLEAAGARDSVPAVVVRDLWGRSRLAGDVLEEVWGLVEGRGVMGGRARLGKEEFVVGLWLIDQRLKGRKLPGRVGESVWKSVGALGGIKLRDHIK